MNSYLEEIMTNFYLSEIKILSISLCMWWKWNKEKNIRVVCKPVAVTTDVKSKLRSKRRWFLLFYLKICNGPFHFFSSCENRVKSVRTGPTFAHYSRSHRSRNHRPISFTGDELKNNSIRADLSFPFAMYTGHDRSGSPGRKALIIISRGEISN